MKIKRYEARTEQEALDKVKTELGLEALILSIKKIQPRGWFAFLRKPRVEITAAYEDKTDKTVAKDSSSFSNIGKEMAKAASSINTQNTKVGKGNPINLSEISQVNEIKEQQQKVKTLEQKLSDTEDLLAKMTNQLSIVSASNAKLSDRKYENRIIQIFYETLVEQGVMPEIAEEILEKVNNIEENDKININLLVKLMYNRIVEIIGQAESGAPKVSKKDAKVIVFMGPTGVGKTTTIAKLSSIFIINYSLKVGLITADTYRIAAVEQLKTYAEILGLEVGVVYNFGDLKVNLEKMYKPYDMILVDTAGRSHKNEDNLLELNKLTSSIKDCEKYLVLSITTKYEDLLNIIDAYRDIDRFNIIFTKLDETTHLGNILNVCFTTGKNVSYITNGQNVPDDISIVKPEKIARALLGLGGDFS